MVLTDMDGNETNKQSTVGFGLHLKTRFNSDKNKNVELHQTYYELEKKKLGLVPTMQHWH